MKAMMRSAVALIALASLVVSCSCGNDGPAGTQAATSEQPQATITATSEEPQARVVDVINDVEADPLAQDEWEDAQEDMVIYLDGQVWSKEASTSRVQTEEALVRVAPNTIFTFGQPDEDTLQVNLEEGQVWVTVEGLEPEETFEVEMPGAVASVRGTRLSARVEPDGTAIVSAQAGTVTVYAASQVVTVTEGLWTVISPNGVPSEPEPMPPEELIRWGMASGVLLDVVLPVVGDAHFLEYSGYVLSYDWAPGGNVFGCSGYDPQGESFVSVFFDVQAGEISTPALPPSASAVFFDPTGGWLVYQSFVGPGETGRVLFDYASLYPTTKSLGMVFPGVGPRKAYAMLIPTPTLPPIPTFTPPPIPTLTPPPVPTLTPPPIPTLLPFDPADFFDPAVGQLAYQLFGGQGEIQLCMADLDGITQVCFGGGASYGWPLWSPQGEWILFFSDRDSTNGESHLYIARPDGSDMTQLTFGAAGYDIRQSWSPDGGLIAYVHTNEYNGSGDVLVMGADGSDPRVVFHGIYGDGSNHIEWSPDASWLAVAADSGGLWLVDPISLEAWMVLGTEGWEISTPVWSPSDDGWPLFFVGYDPAAGQGGLWYVSGPDQAPSYFGEFSWGPVWASNGTAVAFGLTGTGGDGPQTRVFLFQTEPSFWQ